MASKRTKPEWPSETVEDLLRAASISSNPDTRRRLCDELDEARRWHEIAVLLEQPPDSPREKAYDAIAKAAADLLAAMDRFKRLYGDLPNWMQGNAAAWFKGHESTLAGVEALLGDVECKPAQRGQPQKLDREFPVSLALKHLCKYAPNFPDTGQLSPRQVEFVELFYETVSGEEDARGALDWQIRKTLSEIRKLRGI